jgi:hypothetical protein
VTIENSAVEVDDTDISGAAVCLEIRGSQSPSLRGSAIHDCSEIGVLIVGPSSPWIAHNVIQRNKVFGLAAREGARPSLVNNIFEQNSLELPASLTLESVRSRNFFPVPRPRGKKQ